MARVELWKKNAPALKWRARSIESMSRKLVTNISDTALPGENPRENKLVKAKANDKKITFTSKIVSGDTPFRPSNQTIQVVSVSGKTDNVLIPNEATVLQQIKALEDAFFPIGVDADYEIRIYDVPDNLTTEAEKVAYADANEPVLKDPCVISDMDINESKDAPDVWTLTISVLVGESVIVVEDR